MMIKEVSVVRGYGKQFVITIKVDEAELNDVLGFIHSYEDQS
jgi:hypothetical protein